ncbi:MAG: hypothetical protein ACP5OC_08030, partial [Thermoplasmata archaeon]
GTHGSIRIFRKLQRNCSIVPQIRSEFRFQLLLNNLFMYPGTGIFSHYMINAIKYLHVTINTIPY